MRLRILFLALILLADIIATETTQEGNLAQSDMDQLIEGIIQGIEGTINDFAKPIYLRIRADPLLNKIFFAFTLIALTQFFLFNLLGALFGSCCSKVS